MIRLTQPDDHVALVSLAHATGLFQPDELEDFSGLLAEYFEGNLGADHYWIADDEGGLLGAAYFAPEQFSDGVWNLYFIGILPNHQGRGRGTALLSHVEEELRARNERLLLVETSGLENFELTRSFYRKNGYEEEARIRDYYREGDDKVIFCKAL